MAACWHQTSFYQNQKLVCRYCGEEVPKDPPMISQDRLAYFRRMEQE